MDFRKFDELTKRLSSDTPRRSIVKGGAAAALGALVGVFRHEAVEAGCKGKNKTCKDDGDCCSKDCDIDGNDKKGKCKCSKTGKKCKKTSDCCRNDDECTGNGNKKCQPVT